MAVIKISVDTESPIKNYICLTTDLIDNYPYGDQCGAGSTMVVFSYYNDIVAHLKFDGNKWEYVNQENELYNIKDIMDYELVTSGGALSDNFVVNCKDRSIKNARINCGYDIPQIETAVVVGVITKAGICTVTVTSALYANPIVMNIAVALNDTAILVAGKIRSYIAPILAGEFTVSGIDANVVLTTNYPFTDDATLNISVENGTCEGLTDDTTSTDTQASGAINKFLDIYNAQNRCKVELEVNYFATTDITYNPTITWLSGAEPVLTAGKLYVMTFRTINGGVSWYGDCNAGW